MKLVKYENKSEKKRKIILVSLGVIMLICVSLFLYKTFASFSEEVEFPIMKGQVDYFGNSDVYFAFYNGNDKLDSMPLKDNNENLVFDYGECDNGAYVDWNNEEWAPLIRNLSKSKTKCSLYFKEKTSINICNKYGNDSALCYISKLGDNDYDNMAYDHASANDVLDNNLRYIGLNPNNYIDIGDRTSDEKPILWRVIGVMNNIISLDDEEKQESLIKIIRADSIGAYSWDSSIKAINDGYGVNEWSQADLMKLLNPQEVYNETSLIGGSLYWNKGSGSCYSDVEESNKACNFTSNGISEEAKEKIAKVRWNTGTAGEDFVSNKEKFTAKYIYEGERSKHNGKEVCESTGGKYCNDIVSRTTTWDGYIGLMYPSDYGYAVGGEVRNICLEKNIYEYNNDDCYVNDWLKRSSYTWTITPLPDSFSSTLAFCVNSSGFVYLDGVSDSLEVVPTAYLKKTLKILSNSKPDLEYGSKENPFIVE